MADQNGTAEAPGYKTTEFWITLVLMFAGVITGVGLPEESVAVRIAGFAIALGATLGYQVVRGSVKKTQLDELP